MTPPPGRIGNGRQRVKSSLKVILRTVDGVSEWVGKVISFLMVVIIFVMVYETVMRYVFNAPTIWADDLTWNLAGAFFLLGGAYVLRHKGHVNMDVVYNRFPLRVRAILDLFTATLFFSFCGVLLWHGVPFAWRSLMMQELTLPPVSLPVYPVKMTLPIAAFLLGLQGLSKFICDFITAIAGEKYEY